MDSHVHMYKYMHARIYITGIGTGAQTEENVCHPPPGFESLPMYGTRSKNVNVLRPLYGNGYGCTAARAMGEPRLELRAYRG